MIANDPYARFARVCMRCKDSPWLEGMRYVDGFGNSVLYVWAMSEARTGSSRISAKHDCTGCYQMSYTLSKVLGQMLWKLGLDVKEKMPVCEL